MQEQPKKVIPDEYKSVHGHAGTFCRPLGGFIAGISQICRASSLSIQCVSAPQPPITDIVAYHAFGSKDY